MEDIHKCLSSEDKQALSAIAGKVAQYRNEKGKTVDDYFFVLNMKDELAQDAIEAYIEAGDTAIKNTDASKNSGLVAAVGKAREVRAEGIMHTKQRMPD